MIFITGPLYSGKRDLCAERPAGHRASPARCRTLQPDADDLEKLADKLAAVR